MFCLLVEVGFVLLLLFNMYNNHKNMKLIKVVELCSDKECVKLCID